MVSGNIKFCLKKKSWTIEIMSETQFTYIGNFARVIKKSQIALLTHYQRELNVTD